MTPSAVLIGTLLAAGAIYFGFAAYVWANHRGVASRPLVVMLLALKIWTLCYALELSSHTIGVAQWWSGLKFVGIVLLPPGLWAFVHEYTGRGPLPRKWLLLMTIEPILVLGALATPSLAGLVHTYADPPSLLLGAPVPEAGELFIVHAGYTYLLMLGAVAVLVAKLTRIAPAYRSQGAVLAVFSVLPFVTNAIWNFTGADDDWIDPTPLVFGLTAIVMVWGFFRLKLLDLVPVARAIVIEQMNDGVIVLDVYGRIADANAAAGHLIGCSPSALIGRPADELLPALQPLLDAPALADGEPTMAEVTIGQTPLVAGDPMAAATLESPGVRDVAVSLTPVTDQTGRQVARSLVLRDVTQRNRTERQLRQLLEDQTKLSETLRQALRPAELPEVPNLRLAARSVPSARGGGVGGDFYDVHSTANGRSAFVLGDVSGKGVHAAVVTSLARYTVRTLSAQGLSPRTVLHQLNQALLKQDDDERFCTVVYGHVLPSPDGREGVRLVLTLGGHPLPLVRRREGTVHAVGVPGTALGLLPSIDVTEVVVDLAAGDVLLAYTDGVTEARNGDEQFGEDRLAEVLAGVQLSEFTRQPQVLPAPAEQLVAHQGAAETVAIPARPFSAGYGDLEHGDLERGDLERGDLECDGRVRAGQMADAVADAVLRAVSSFSSERDDVALLVLAAT
jgi:serine phosphatase RsbU (regulator of sigma subunit)